MPFAKGDKNINRNGAPKRDWTWSGELQKAVEQANEEGKSVKEVVSDSLVKEAIKGNVQAVKEIMNRMDGMPQQDITSNGETIIPHVTLDTRPD